GAGQREHAPQGGGGGGVRAGRGTAGGHRRARGRAPGAAGRSGNHHHGGRRVNVHEYQARELLGRFGIPFPPGEVATTPDEARAIAQRLGVRGEGGGGGRGAGRARVHAGGRGRDGGGKRDK